MMREHSSRAPASSAGTPYSLTEKLASEQIRTIPIGSLRQGETVREHSQDHEYVTRLAQSPGKLPPIIVHRTTMRVIDGLHRLKAAELRGERSIDVIFFDGDEEDAFVAAISSNAHHGMPLSFAERTAAAARILRSHPQWPDRAIATATGLPPNTVDAVRHRSGLPDAQSPRQTYRGTCPMAEVLDQVCDDLFATLTRRDQRLRARQYLRGLLETPGRKTIRNVAAFIGGPSMDQRLHHFISDSTWDWELVRTALTRYVIRTMAPEAWVVRPVVIPKVGHQAVGVSRRFCPARRKAVHGQQAVGILAVTETASIPVSWRLQVPREWVEDDLRRSRAALPDELGVESLGQCTAQALLHLLSRIGGTDRPALLDARDAEAAQLLQPLCAAEVPVLVRIPHNIALYVSDPGFAGHRAHGPLTARQIVEAAGFRRRLFSGLDSGIDQAQIVTTIDVQWTAGVERPHSAAAVPLQLLAIRPLGENANEELWLTTLRTMPTASVLRLTKLVRRVDRDIDQISEQVGIWDFSGRSFPGWHRHVTLASVAYVVRVLVHTGYRPDVLTEN
jgi:hypothetical protein